MLFTSSTPIPAETAAAIVRAVRTIDASALVSVDAQLICIEGALDAARYLRTIAEAGCEARAEDSPRTGGHVRGGSECCGGCA